MLAAHPTCARRGDEWWWPGPPEPCIELAIIDDHIVAIAFGGDVDDPANRQGLCTGCHHVKSQVEATTSRRP